MGRELFDQVPQFSSVEREVDGLLGYSLRELCLEDPENRLQQTQYTQPALYVVNALHYYKAIAEGRRADFLAGHSLGEYNALLAAGAFDFVTGLRLVQKRGELMARARDGGMAAVVGLTAERVAALLAENDLTAVDVANYNSLSQIVISGPSSDIGRAKPVMEQAGARLYVPLAVSAAFHSRYMEDASRLFGDFLATIEFKRPQVPVISNVAAEPYPSDDSNDAVRSLLARQIASPVRWHQSMRYVIGAGATDFEEMGPGTVLTRLIKQIQREAA